MGILKNVKKMAIKQFIDSAAGPLDELAESLGVPVDKIAEALAGIGEDSGSSKVKTSTGETVERMHKRIAKDYGPGIAERMLVSAGEFIAPEVSKGIGTLTQNKYNTLSRIMAGMRDTNESRRNWFGPSLSDIHNDAYRAVAERKGANAKEVADRIANAIQNTTAYQRRENEKVRAMQAAVEPALEGRTGILENTRMLRKDADRINKGD